MRKLSFFFGGTLFLGFLLTATAFKPLPKAVTAKKFATSSVNGGGSAIEGGVKSTFVFNAVSHEDGSTNGHLVYNLRLSGVTIQMDIDCLNILAGNRATLGGTVTSVSGDNIPNYIFVGQRASFTVEDNGNGGSNDKISDLFLGSETSCADNWSTYLSIQGNITIRE